MKKVGRFQGQSQTELGLSPFCSFIDSADGLQENATKRDDVPPNQGGKYVGFGSGPPPAAPRRGGQAGGIDDVLSKGFSQLSTVAGSPP